MAEATAELSCLASESPGNPSRVSGIWQATRDSENSPGIPIFGIAPQGGTWALDAARMPSHRTEE